MLAHYNIKASLFFGPPFWAAAIVCDGRMCVKLRNPLNYVIVALVMLSGRVTKLAVPMMMASHMLSGPRHSLVLAAATQYWTRSEQ